MQLFRRTFESLGKNIFCHFLERQVDRRGRVATIEFRFGEKALTDGQMEHRMEQSQDREGIIDLFWRNRRKSCLFPFVAYGATLLY